MSQWVKKAIAILIALIFVITSIQFSFGAEKFNDISKHWSKEYVNEMVDKKILSGYPDGTFRPEDAVSKTQALVAISRMFDADEVDRVYNSNKAKYESDFDKYSIPDWARKSFVFCIERGIFQRNLLEFVVEKGKASTARRWEIPIYIGKALGYTNDGKVQVIDFEDAGDIPKSALSYVGILVDKKIISGQTEYPSKKVVFNPYGEVKRGELAKMLKLSNDLIVDSDNSSGNSGGDSEEKEESDSQESDSSDSKEESIIKIPGEIYSVSTLNGQTVLMIETSKGTRLSFKNKTSEIQVELGGEDARVSDIVEGDKAEIRVSGDKLVSVDIEDRDESFDGYFIKSNFKLGSDGLSRTFVQIEVDGNTREFEIDADSDIEIDGKDSSVYDLEEDDKVKVEIENGVVSEIEALSKEGSVEGYVKEINEKKDYIVIIDKDDEDEDYKFDMDDDVEIRRDRDKDVKLSDIRIGDEVELELEYSEVVEIDASSVSKDVEGIIKEIIISNEPKITILNDDDDLVTYSLAPDFEVEIDNDGAGLYDLRLNYEVELELETDVVKSIECDDDVAVSTITGEIEDVSTRDNIIRIRDNSTNKAVYVRYDSKTTMENYNGRTMDEDDFDEEDVISVIGEDRLGSISADRIIKIQ